MWSALDGNGLDGRRGLAGVLSAEFRDDDTFSAPVIRFYDGVAAGHAVQLGPPDTTGRRLIHLGTFCGTSVFAWADTLELFLPPGIPDFGRGMEVPEFWRGWTHVVWLDARRVIVPLLDGYFWEYDLDHPDHEPKRRGAYLVDHIHAVKRSPSGRSLWYGAMDTNRGGPARVVGTYDLETDTAHLVQLRETAWHMGLANNEDGDEYGSFVSECYEHGPQKSPNQYNFDDLAIGWRNNHVWKIKKPTQECSVPCVRQLSVGAAMPSHLSSDVIALGDRAWTVIHNACASSTIVVSEVHTGRVRYIDERVGFWEVVRTPRFWGAAAGSWLDALAMMHIPGNTHHLVRALRISRGSFLDGSYGLAINTARTRLISGHRGRNELIAYDISGLADLPGIMFIEPPVVARLPLPSLRTFFPDLVGRWGDQRLGLHHMQYLEG